MDCENRKLNDPDINGVTIPISGTTMQCHCVRNMTGWNPTTASYWKSCVTEPGMYYNNYNQSHNLRKITNFS